MKLNAKQLRKKEYTKELLPKTKNPIYIILDDVLDTYNIGSVFRLVDAVAATKLFLCKGSEIPPNHRIKKASINTTEVVEWEYSDNTVDVIQKLRSKIFNIQIIAIEQSANSVQYDKYEYKYPLALIVGHESDGVSKEVLNIVDKTVELPMFGVNTSLNVMVSLSIVLYHVISKLKL